MSLPSIHRLHAARFLACGLLSLLITATSLRAQQAGDSPVKIFILAGQSNMLGQGDVAPATTPGTLEHLVANDPGGDYQFLVDGGGDWVVREDVWIRDQNPSQGGLTVGYGSNGGRVGPELGFGHFIGDLNEQQVLIVKASWGGRDLAVDFRPPSSGETTGFYYNEILRLVNEATSNLGTYFPDYDGGGYEIAGFGWHQGWNDRVDAGRSAEYETNLANFIRDIRTDLGVPGLPFVIATTGMDGGDAYTVVEQAQLAMADATTYPEFVGNVAVIDTRSTYQGLEFWQPEEDSPAVEGFHWNRNAKTYTNIGLAMGDAMSIMAPGRCPFRARATGAAGGVELSWENGTELPTSVRILRNGSEIAATAPADPPTFLDTSAEPGTLDYELQFTMPGDPCDPLTTTLEGGITGLKLAPVAGGIELTWTNNMAYAGIEVRRDETVLEASLSGTSTRYTDTSPPDSGMVTYRVVPANGNSVPATIEVNFSLAGELGALDPLVANGGINPATSSPWQVGDQYRLAFLTSTGTQATSTDITTYNDFVQGLADAAGLGGGTWKVLGSTTAVSARDNTGTNPGTDGEGVSMFLTDGITKIADNHADLWNGNLDHPLNIDENGTSGLTGSVFGGSEPNGTQRSNGRVLGGSGESPPKVTIGDVQKTNGQWMVIFNTNTTTTLPVYALSEPLTIIDSSDETAPTLDSFLDDQGGGPVLVAETITYTLTFSEAIKAPSVGTEDFENASTATLSIDNVSPTADPAIFRVAVTPTGPGELRLAVKPGATITDLAGNALDAGAASPDDTLITVNTETTPPTLLGIVDDVGGGPILADAPVTYSVTFSEPMNASTVGTADFENAGTAPLTIDRVDPTGNAAVFQVAVTPTAAGSLRLRIAAAATLEDLSGNLLNPATANPDDVLITVNDPPTLAGDLGVLDVTANGGINPATGAAWQAGDTYRLVFVTSQTTNATSADISTYNSFVQGVAASSTTYPELGNGTWKIVGSTTAIDARDNTGTNPEAETGVAVFLLDGSTVAANNNADLWNGINASVNLDENAGILIEDRAFTGTLGNGTKVTGTGDQPLGSFGEGLGNIRTGRSDRTGGGWMTNFNQSATNTNSVFAMSEPLTVVSIATHTFSSWIAGFPEVGGQNGFNDDPDGDRLANGLEAWFGTDPGSFDAGLADFATDGTTSSFSHPQNPDAPDDLTGFYQWSTTLGEWHAGDGLDGPAGGPTVTITTNTEAGVTTVTATASEALGRLFLRAGASLD